jgi:hypothetical protein
MQDFNPCDVGTPAEQKWQKGRETLDHESDAVVFSWYTYIVDTTWCNAACLTSKQVSTPEAPDQRLSRRYPHKLAFLYGQLSSKYDQRQKARCLHGRIWYPVIGRLPSSKPSWGPSLLFQNIPVYICGLDCKNTATKATTDAQFLLREGGGNVLKPASQATKIVKEEMQATSTNQVVLLCDESLTDSASGISSNLAPAVCQIYESENKNDRPALIVNSNGLFDSISCAKLLEGDRYKPDSPIAMSLPYSVCLSQITDFK